MTSMMPRKRSFFTQESCSSSSSSTSSSGSCDQLPMLIESRHCESPPPSGSYINTHLDHANSGNNLYAMDYEAMHRIAPGRATSMSIVRQRSGMSLSPTSKARPRKSVSMIFSPNSGGSNVSTDSGPFMMDSYNNPYGMLNPGPRSSNHRNKKPLLSNSMICTIVSIMALVTLSVLGVSTYEHNIHLYHELLIKDQEIEMHLEHAHGLERRVNSMRSETLHLHNRIEELEHPAPTEEELRIQRKVFHLEHYQEQLHSGIAAQSQRLAIEKYGPGPKYYVEMKLAFNSESNIVQDATTEIEDTVWLETASIEEMPHSVHFFLEQVSNGVYDNTAFYRNAPRFVQAGPGQDAQRVEQLEREQPSLAHVLFQEHSRNLNHQQYTLGYPGRPGGPDFYLNLQDNSKQHGLGADLTHRSEFMIEADPCFARIIRGFNTLERIHRSNVQEEDGFSRRKQYQMVHPVTIVSMRVHNMNGSDNTNEQEQVEATSRR